MMRPVAVATLGVYVFTCLLQANVVANIALDDVGAQIVAAVALSMVVLGLHCWHLRFGLAGLRPPHRVASMSALAVVLAAGQVVVGDGWTWTLSLGAISALLVLPSAAGLASLVTVITVSYALQPYDVGLFYALTNAYRSVIFVSVVWFIAAVRHLDELRAELARDAINDERERIGASLAAALGGRLAALNRTSRQARTLIAEQRDDEVRQSLQTLATDARSALDETRRIVTDLRAAGALKELRAARALLTHADESTAGSA
jgi:two-component system sensor histidine kinase DesK